MPVPVPSWRERLVAAPLVAAARTHSTRLLAAGLLAGGVAVGATVAVVAAGGAPVPPEVTLPRATAGMGTGAGASGPPGSSPESGADSSPETAGAEPAYVHAAGAVARPGLYRVRVGGRVADVLDAAGGPSADADLDQVNLAAKVNDGERVYVPRRGEPVPAVVGGAGSAGATAGGGGGPVDLNTATLDQLDELPGIGPATAQAIVDYRAEHGRFSQVQELLEVRGIGEAKLAALRSKVRV